MNKNKDKRGIIMKKLFSEFKEFALKGNVLDMAIGVVIGTAFKAIVTSLVDDIIMPLVGVIIGGKDFSALVLKVGEAEIKYGMLIQNIVDFLLVAVVLFAVIKTINKMHDMLKKQEEVLEEAAEEAEINEELEILKKISETLDEIKAK